MKRLKTMANELLELAENMDEWDKYIDKIKKPEEDEKLQAIINDRNELITKLLLLDLETRFQFSERPSKAQTKWFKDNWGLSENTLDFYRNRKNKSINQQFNELDDKAKELISEENAESFNIDENISNDELVPIDNNSDTSIENQSNENNEADKVFEQKELSKISNLTNKRSIEESPWDKCSFENLCLLEPFCHNPYQYGDIMENGKVFVWNNKYTDKETFLKSYSKSKQFLKKKKELGLSITDIVKKTGLPRHIVNNSVYYPYIKIDGMLLEQFERKYEKL